ncbi:MAG: nucleoside triphosphate pyrophosphohydrolase [Gammaproteobacteria bacterium]|nr:nucleoside triphosphate pyrophosphohydrolase [Gammaproteobacteria bacterium]
MSHIDELLAVMARLRDPQAGCPWDREQTFATIAPYTIEEAYEVADAIEHGDLHDLKDELGDLLFQVVFHARMAEEQGAFGFSDVVAAIVEKMRRRHPHVFAGERIDSAAEQSAAWEAHKARERVDKGGHESVLDGITRTLPALARAEKLQKRAARTGFDWPNLDGVLAKIEEELQEVRAEIAAGDSQALHGEIGELLFACANLARHAGVDAETALRATNQKFDRRFRYVEAALRVRGKRPEQSDLAEMDALWEEAKRMERSE